MSVASVLSSVSTLPLPQAAALLAAAGVPVLPCVPGAKNPLLKPDEENPEAQPGGFHAATIYARQVAAWWRRWPWSACGSPTDGPASIPEMPMTEAGWRWGAWPARPS